MNQETYPDLPEGLRTPHDLQLARERYLNLVAPAGSRFPAPLDAPISSPYTEGTIPWVIEAPYNSVEMLEAILQPAEPLVVRTAPHVPPSPAPPPDPARRRGDPLGSTTTTTTKVITKRWAEYRAFQGRLERPRAQVRYVALPRRAIGLVESRLRPQLLPVRLSYLSLPWADAEGAGALAHPYAAVAFARDADVDDVLAKVLRRCRIPGCRFERSLLPAADRAPPLPGCLYEWFAGIPGRAAERYREKGGWGKGSDDEMEEARGEEEEEEEDKEHIRRMMKDLGLGEGQTLPVEQQN
ncbi:hypothetical protein F4780DRAFT_791961 [Xylariomycetidae sp. FL0641]|nr:hypothetical protein F4780DRAFT_791961 [Xylariomycetidae sp. FL0641]